MNQTLCSRSFHTIMKPLTGVKNPHSGCGGLFLEPSIHRTVAIVEVRDKQTRICQKKNPPVNQNTARTFN